MPGLGGKAVKIDEVHLQYLSVLLCSATLDSITLEGRNYRCECYACGFYGESLEFG